MKAIYIGKHNSPILESLLSSQEVVGIAESVKFHYSSLLSHFAFKLNDFYLMIKGLGNYQLSSIAKNNKIPFFAFTKNDQRDLTKWIKNLSPEVIIVNSMGHLLSKEIVDIPQLTIINYHPSLLPKYPGPNPSFWLYYNMDLNAGGTVHLVDNGEDTGDILFEESFDLSLGEPHEIYIKKSQALGAKLVMKAIDGLEKGVFTTYKQFNDSNYKRARRVTKIELKKMINWEQWPVKRVFHFLRGLPYPTFVLPVNKPFKIYNWIPLNFQEEITHEIPGRIIKDGNRFLLICKDGFIELKSNNNIIALLKLYLIYYMPNFKNKFDKHKTEKIKKQATPVYSEREL